MSLSTNLQAAYTFETSGTHLGDDSTGNAFNLTNHGSVPQAGGNASAGTNAANFPASASIYLGGNAQVVRIPAGPADWEFSCWARPTTVAQGYDMFIAGLELFPAHQWSVWAGNSKQFLFITNNSGGGGAESGTQLFDGQAVFVANTYYFVNCWFTASGLTMKIDRNNSGSPASTTVAGIFGSGFNGMLIGATPDFGGGFGYNGRVDGLTTWTHNNTTGDRTSLYNAGTGLEYPFSVAASGRRRSCCMFKGKLIQPFWTNVFEIEDIVNWGKRRIWAPTQELWRPKILVPQTG